MAVLLLLSFSNVFASYETQSGTNVKANKVSTDVKGHVAKKTKPRTIVTTDGEVDDMNSFIRFLLYTNEFDVEGLIYSSSQWHYSGDGKGTIFISEMPNTRERYGYRTELRWTGTKWIQRYIDKYAEVYNTLVQHDPGYPTPDYLQSITKVGNIEFEGEMEKDTEGSDYIKEILLDDEPGPIYLQIWGGTNTIARALKSIEEEYKNTPQWKEIYDKVSQKAVIYMILDQDATYKKYVAPNWPKIKVLYNSNQFWTFAYPWRDTVPDELQTYLRGKWMAENIKFNHGPLMSAYFVYGDGQQIAGDPEHTHGNREDAISQGRLYDFISEGDSPAYFHLIDVGLRNIEDPAYGGWGGRLVPSLTNPYRWEDGTRAADFSPYTNSYNTAYPQTRWVDVLQNDFAARADWTVKSYDKANHAPFVTLKHNRDINVKVGQKVHLQGFAKDPDGDKLTYRWWQYKEADTYEGAIRIINNDKKNPYFVVPADAKNGDTIHVILEVSDSGTPKLTRYQRTIATVRGSG